MGRGGMGRGGEAEAIEHPILKGAILKGAILKKPERSENGRATLRVITRIHPRQTRFDAAAINRK